ncbi:carbohydrate kinase family protein [Roseateles violae]|uniref:Carbohydrate kinase n=1 Tax=Roseateles violae TaxID=3058042 RepID=A0ABT8DNG8_9BURK|nr:carbohydrate kinase [Pelomonas sp. PFR6]MDN3919916.1 carbohydrate kinase [Pelomonas sp. PFR6]
MAPPLLHADLPHFVSFGEALTDLLRSGPNSWRSRCGGAPWNVAMAMSGLGVMSAFAGGISQDVFGQAIWQASADASLDLRFIQQFAKPPLLAIVHQLEPPRYFFIGEDSADLHFRPEALPQGWQQALAWAHFGGLSLAREPLAGRLLALAQALKAQGRSISYDPNYRDAMDTRYDATLERMCRLADLIKVSDEDLCGLFRSPDPRLGLAQISAWNPQAWLLATHGAAGATLYRGTRHWTAAAPPVQVLDTVGAGDAAVAGLLYSLMRQREAAPARHLAWAVAAGTAACTVAGAGSAPRALVERLDALISPAPGA